MNGGLTSLGAECGKALLEHGLAKLALFDTFDKPKDKIDGLRAFFPDAEVIYTIVDITDETLVSHCVQAVAHRFGRLDILISLSSTPECSGPTLGTRMTEWHDPQAVNIAGAFAIAQAAAKCMIEYRTAEQRGCEGSIVYVALSSSCRDTSIHAHAVSEVLKAGINQLTRSLAAEWAQHGIRVNCISLGLVEADQDTRYDPAKNIWFTNQSLMRRRGTIDEAIGPVVLLCSAAGSCMTGVNLTLDGESFLIASITFSNNPKITRVWPSY